MHAAYEFMVGSFYAMAGIVCLTIAAMMILITVREIISKTKKNKK